MGYQRQSQAKDQKTGGLSTQQKRAPKQPRYIHRSVQRACSGSQENLRPEDMLNLQNSIGNQRVNHLLEGGALDASLQQQIAAARGTGSPLSRRIRQEMERSLETALGDVRIHTGAPANALAHSVNALAFTTGRDIFFSQGAYRPETAAGRKILAHELAHVAQQGSLKNLTNNWLTLGPTGDRTEQEADRTARVVEQGGRVAAGRVRSSSPVTTPTVQRLGFGWLKKKFGKSSPAIAKTGGHTMTPAEQGGAPSMSQLIQQAAPPPAHTWTSARPSGPPPAPPVPTSTPAPKESVYTSPAEPTYTPAPAEKETTYGSFSEPVTERYASAEALNEPASTTTGITPASSSGIYTTTEAATHSAAPKKETTYGSFSEPVTERYASAEALNEPASTTAGITPASSSGIYTTTEAATQPAAPKKETTYGSFSESATERYASGEALNEPASSETYAGLPASALSEPAPTRIPASGGSAPPVSEAENMQWAKQAKGKWGLQKAEQKKQKILSLPKMSEYEGEEEHGFTDAGVKHAPTYYHPSEAPNPYGMQVSGGKLMQGGKVMDTIGTQAQFAKDKFNRYMFTRGQSGEFKAANVKAETAKHGPFHHTSMSGGEEAAAAGEMRVAGGQLETIADTSGHYRPAAPMTYQALQSLQQQKVDLSRTGVELSGKAKGEKALQLSATEFMSYGPEMEAALKEGRRSKGINMPAPAYHKSGEDQVREDMSQPEKKIRAAHAKKESMLGSLMQDPRIAELRAKAEGTSKPATTGTRPMTKEEYKEQIAGTHQASSSMSRRMTSKQALAERERITAIWKAQKSGATGPAAAPVSTSPPAPSLARLRPPILANMPLAAPLSGKGIPPPASESVIYGSLQPSSTPAPTAIKNETTYGAFSQKASDEGTYTRLPASVMSGPKPASESGVYGLTEPSSTSKPTLTPASAKKETTYGAFSEKAPDEGTYVPAPNVEDERKPQSDT